MNFYFVVRFKKLANVLNNLIIPIDVYNKMKKIYTGDINKLDEYIWIILFRYNLLGSNNHQLGILHDILEKMRNDLNLNFECFASSINSSLPNYCSIYYDVEKYFGSKGSFFNMTPISGTFSFNPPYQINVINNGIFKILHHLDIALKNKLNLNFIITIPIWDKKGKKIIKEKYKNFSKLEINYDDFTIIDKIKSSKHFKGYRMIPKEEFTYLDHNYFIFKDITIQNTYVIILSSDPKNNYIEIINKYCFKK